jgi:plastocyanin
MKRKSLAVALVVLLGISCLLSISLAAEEIKISTKVVAISASGADPITVTSDTGTTVVWMNQFRSPIEILFVDKKVALACGVPVNFIIGKNGAYESAKIPQGGTASLCFTEKGEYEYTIRSSRTFYPGRVEHRGGVKIK